MTTWVRHIPQAQIAAASLGPDVPHLGYTASVECEHESVGIALLGRSRHWMDIAQSIEMFCRREHGQP